MNSETQLASHTGAALPSDRQEINIIAVASLGCQRATYWARTATDLQFWIAAGGFQQEAGLPRAPATPAVDLRVLPDDPRLATFYAASSRVLERAMAAARSTTQQRATDC